jgi:hypothetical protein
MLAPILHEAGISPKKYDKRNIILTTGALSLTQKCLLPPIYPKNPYILPNNSPTKGMLLVSFVFIQWRHKKAPRAIKEIL